MEKKKESAVRKLLSNERGQSTIEFALTLILMMSFILFYLQISFVFAFGNYAHYATFMSARAYLSASDSRGDQASRARDVIVRLLKRSAGQAGVDKFPSIAKGTGGGDPGGFQVENPSQFSETDDNFSWLQGVRYTFRSKLFMLPFAGSVGNASVNSVTLTSESWLGREPPYDECQKEMSRYNGIFDNGC